MMETTLPTRLNSPPLPTVTTELTPAQSSILPYTQNLAGVNLKLNSITSNILWGSLGLLLFIIFLIRVIHIINAERRLQQGLRASQYQQPDSSSDNTYWAKVKKHLLVAPLIHKRHNKEIQLSAAINAGTIPSRLHTLLLALYILSNVVYCLILDFRNQPRAALLAEARGRTGHLAVMNMLALFIFAARNNPFIQLLGIPFDTFNLFHRWIGRIIIIESVAHVFIWGTNNYDALGLKAMTAHLITDTFLIYGLVATCAMVGLLIHSPSAIRHAFYESFLAIHQFLALVAFVGILLHCTNQSLPQKPFVIALGVIWVIERCLRVLRILYLRSNTVQVEALEDGACRLTFQIKGSWPNQPGRHIYTYIPSISAWMSHPFSVAWVDRNPWNPVLNKESQTISTNSSETDFQPMPTEQKQTAISCIVASRTGMTKRLYDKAKKSPTKMITLRAWVEGPYGTAENMRSYGTVLLFSGGAGITFQLSQVKDLIDSINAGTAATKRVALYWSVRNKGSLSWAKRWLDEMRAQELRGGAELKIVQYVTRRSCEVPSTPSLQDTEAGKKEEQTINVREREKEADIRYGRMDVTKVIEEEFENRISSMNVSVCGPGGLADDVRTATREFMGRGGVVDFEEECFTW